MTRDLVSPKLDQVSIFTLIGNTEASLNTIAEIKEILRNEPNEEMIPYVFETSGATYLYAGELDTAFSAYSSACKLAETQGLGGTYFNAPRNYVNFLVLHNESPKHAYDWLVQESFLEMPNTAVDRALHYAYLGIASVQSGFVNKEFLEIGMSTEDFVLYIRTLAYLAELNLQINPNEKKFIDPLLNLRGCSFLTILRWDLAYLPRVASILGLQSLRQPTSYEILFHFQITGVFNISYKNSTMSLKNNAGNLVLAAALISKHPYPMASLINDLNLVQSDQIAIKQSLKRLNQKIISEFNLTENLCEFENGFVYINNRYSITLDIDQKLNDLDSVLQVDPEQILPGFEGVIFDEYRTEIHERLVAFLIGAVKNMDTEDSEILEKVVRRTMRLYHTEYDLLNVLLKPVQKVNLPQLSWLQNQLNDVSF